MSDLETRARIEPERDRPAAKTNNINYSTGVVMDDPKGRFQLSCLVACPNVPNDTKQLVVFHFRSIRATVGHSEPVDQGAISAKVFPEHYEHLAAISHKTKVHLLP